jgi:hypothetical protein
LDPHWHERRTQQAQGRGLRFDSHDDLPEELKNVAVQRFISKSEDPSFIGKLMGYRRERTGDEILERLSKEKEVLNERFRQLLREVGTQKKTAAYEFGEKQAFGPAALAAPLLWGVGVPALGWGTYKALDAVHERISPTPPPPPPVINIAPENMNPWAAGAMGAAAVATPLAAYYAYRRWADRKKKPEEKISAYEFGKKQASSTLESLLNNKLLAGSLWGGTMGGVAGAVNAEKGKRLRGALRGVTFGVPVGLFSAAGGKALKGFSDTELAYGGKPVGALPGYQQFMHNAAEPTGALLGGLAGIPFGAHMLAKIDKEIEKTDQHEKDTKKKDEKAAAFRWYKRFPMTENLAVNLSLGGPSLTVKKLIPGTSFTFGKRAPRMYVGTPIPGLAYQQYLSPKKHKIKAEKEFKDDPNDSRSTYEKIRDFFFGSEYGPDAD